MVTVKDGGGVGRRAEQRAEGERGVSPHGSSISGPTIQNPTKSSFKAGGANGAVVGDR